MKPKLIKRARDIQIHTVVTVTNRVRNIEVIGEKETEFPQFCVQIDANHTPVRKKDLQAAFTAFYAKVLDQMRTAGLLRAGD